MVVFSAADEPGWPGQLWLRPVNSLVAKPLPDTVGAINPFWSPDSRWVAFFAGKKLKKISVDGGASLEICESPTSRGGNWGSAGIILFVPGVGVPVNSVPSAGGVPTEVTSLDASLGELTQRWPVFLPDGKHFLFFSRGRENATYASALGSKERKLVLKNESNVLYAPPGYLLFVRNRVLMAQRFDVKRLELTGTAMAIAQDVPLDGGWQHALFSVSDDGILAIQPEKVRLSQPQWVDPSGKTLEPLGEPSPFLIANTRIAPDGQKIAFGIADLHDGSSNIWIYDIARRQRTRLTFEALSAQLPVWSPDSSRIIFTSNRVGIPKLFSISATGIGEAVPFSPTDQSDIARSWSDDGRYIALTRAPASNLTDLSIWILPLFGDRKMYPLLGVSHSGQWHVRFSPDGKWLAYQSNESGSEQVYVVPFPDANSKLQVSRNGGGEPGWAPNGKKLYYLDHEGMLTAAEVSTSTHGLQVMATKSLFKVDPPFFDVSADGKRFLVFKDVPNQSNSTITLITNWTALLDRN